VPATAALLAGTGVEGRWHDRVRPLLADLGLEMNVL